MKFRKLVSGLYICVQVGTLAQQNTTNSQPVLTPQLVNELAEEARTNNAGLWASRSRLRAAEENARSIPLWRNPELMAGGMAADRPMREEQGDIIFGVEQMLPVFGKEKTLRAAAKADIAVEKADLEMQFQTLRKVLAQSVIKAVLADEVLQVSREDVVWLETLQKAVEERYRVGDASQLDVLKAQNERSRREQQLHAAANDRHAAWVEVNRLLNRSLISAWPEMRLPPVGGPVPFTDHLLALASRFDPKLKVMREQLERAKAAVEVSRKERRPDLSAAVETRNYSRAGEERSAEVLLKMTIPWVNRDKYRAAIRRDEARVEEASYQIEDYLHALRAEVHHMTSRIENARREALLYRDEIIPRSELALRSAEAAWQSSRDVFRDVLEARRMLLEARLMYVRAVAEQYMNMAELVLCCGVADLEALEMLGKQDREKEGQ
jgi:outer membrane protein TolC